VRISLGKEQGLPALLQEALEQYEQSICPALLAAGFSDLLPDRLFVLGAMALGGSPFRVMPSLGIEDAKTSRMIETLVSGGYLERSADAVNGDDAPAEMTDRGYAAATVIVDSILGARWTDFEFRAGDIVISTPAKSGTTWVQMICALLIFQTPDLPEPLSKLSPWLDRVQAPRDKVYAELAAQKHRRCFKTHTPLNDIVLRPEATYIVVARHPLDVAVSRYRFHAAMNGGAEQPRGLPEFKGRERMTLREQLLLWIDRDTSPRNNRESLPGVMWHLSDAWARRTEPNVVLLHYDELSADLEGEMRRLAERLGIALPETAWRDLAHAASFKQMRAAADRLAPVDALTDKAAFFRGGTSGSGREVLTSEEIARYYARAAQFAPPDLLAWLHRERNGAHVAAPR
jgi:aryl sulfotransferase